MHHPNTLLNFWLLLFLLMSSSLNAAIRLQEQWSFPLGESAGFSTPALFPDEQNPSDIIIVSNSGILYRIGPGGEIRFEYDLAEAAGCNPAVGDINNDGSSEIVVASVSGVIHCVNSAGKILWRFETNSRVPYTLVLADVNMDGRLEILAATVAGWLYCLTSDGALHWKFYAEPQSGPPAVGDLDGDGAPEIVYGTDLHKIFCLDHSGQYRWHIPYDGYFGRSLPLIADVDGNGTPEVLLTRSEVCHNSAVIAIDGIKGSVLWEAPTTMHGYGPLGIADIDRDGALDIIVVDKSTSIYCFDSSGKRKWERVLQGHGIFFPPAIADFDGDGKFELVSGKRIHGNYDDVITMLDDRGSIVLKMPLKGGGNCQPTIGDLDGDSKIELYMVTQHPGRLVQYEVADIEKSGKILWSTWQANSRRTGYIAHPTVPLKAFVVKSESIRPEESFPPISAFLGQNQFKLEIPKAFRKHNLLLQTRTAASSGTAVTTLAFVEVGSPHFTALYDFESTAEISLELKLIDQDSRKVVKARFGTAALNGFAADLNFIHSRLNTLDSLSNERGSLLPDDIDLFDMQKMKLHAEHGRIEALAGQFGEMPGEAREAFVQRLNQKRRDALIAESRSRFLVTQRRFGNLSPFVCWEDLNPWDDTPPHQDYPNSDLSRSAIEVLALGNETETRAINITSFCSRAQILKIKPVTWQDSSGSTLTHKGVIEFREGIEIGTVENNTIMDALPRLNEASTIVVPAESTRQLWLTFRTHGLKPGSYIADLTLYSLGVENPEQNAKLVLTVAPVALPEKSRLSFYTWAHLGADASHPLSQKKFADLLDHGITVFGISAPVQRFDEAGNLTGEVDWAQHDAWMLKFKGKGIVLVPSFQHTIQGPASAPLWSDTWKKAYIAGIRRYVAHVRQLGFNYDDFALYPVDEPWLTGMAGVKILYDCASLAKQADARIQIYCDPAGMPTPENSAEMVPYVDIWMPMIDLLKREDKSLLNFYKSTGAKVWAYEAPGPTKLLKPLGLYRMQPWLAFRYGLTGCGIWTYDYKNIWTTNQPAPFHFSYSTIYDDGESIVTSRRWEAYRDGVEDFNLLTLLRDEIDRNKANKQLAKLAKTAEELLHRALMEVTAKQELADSNNRFLFDYDPDYPTLIKYREQLIDMLVKLRRAGE
ncbi:VCBS repeat-containing protein [candidate division KSB1 bacterium]|nr:VCBS repeat-containing protein [candidate division KSB1 bacterium]